MKLLIFGMSNLEIDWFKISNILKKAIDKGRLFWNNQSMKRHYILVLQRLALHSIITLNTIVVDSSILKSLVKDTFVLRA